MAHYHYHATHPVQLDFADAGLMLPTPQIVAAEDDATSHVCRAGPFRSASPSLKPDVQDRFLPGGSYEGIWTTPLPGVRCPTCAKDGKEVWVIPGRACGYCGTACG